MTTWTKEKPHFAGKLPRVAWLFRYAKRSPGSVRGATYWREFDRLVRAALEADPNVVDAANTLGIGTSTLHAYLAQRPHLTNGIAMRGPGNPDAIEGARRRREAAAKQKAASVARKKPSR